MGKLQKLLIGGMLGLLACFNAQAENYVDVGEYKIHYNAVPTHLLTPEVARAYGIQRSQNRAMLNVTVLRKGGEGQLDTAITAKVGASATNLTGQRREIDMRLISEQEAHYYIGEVRVANEENLEFKVQVLPDGVAEPFELAFRQKFYVADDG